MFEPLGANFTFVLRARRARKSLKTKRVTVASVTGTVQGPAGRLYSPCVDRGVLRSHPETPNPGSPP
jgi:hypothetical protein